MHLLGSLEETGPELLLQFLLAQDKLNVAVAVVHLAVLGFNFGIQIKRDLVCYPLSGGTGECDIFGSNVELRIGPGHISSLDVHIEVIAFGVRRRGALGPCDCRFKKGISNSYNQRNVTS